jgi:hypothetical protein
VPALLGVGNGQYTAISTAGTTTLNPGQPAGAPPPAPGVLYGLTQIAPGTSFAATVLDLVPPSNIGTNTTTITNTLLSGTGTAGQRFVAGLEGVGVRYRGALVVVSTGTPGQINALWD